MTRVAGAAATLERVDGQADLYRLRGALDFAAVPALLDSGRRLFPERGAVRLDLGNLESANSAGLALLLEWHRELQRSGRKLKLLNVPATLVNIARVSELESILDLPS
jgi:phospholipid transport system transporter-binding protein